jgi:hypothetical protein
MYMLEQFRIIQAALRLREKFTISDLARESGVAPGTVQKTLRRRTDLFTSVDGVPTGRRGSRPKLYHLNADTANTALQAAADEIPLPEVPPSLGVKLAEDTLVRVLPRAALEEREDLMEAVENQLALSTDATDQKLLTELQDLHHNLHILIAMQAWLLGLFRQLREAVGYDATLASIEAVLTVKERQSRSEDAGRLARTAAAILSLPIDTSTLAANAASLRIDTAPVPAWWIQIPAAVWSVLRNKLWADVVGDLTNPEILYRAATPHFQLDHIPTDEPRTEILPARAGKVVFGRDIQRVIGKPNDPNLATLPPILIATAPVRYWPKHVGTSGQVLTTRPRSTFSAFRPMYVSPADLSLGIDGFVRVRLDYSVSPTILVGPTGQIQFQESHSGSLECFDLNLTDRRAVGATLRLKDPQEHAWVSYNEIRPRDGNFVYRHSLGLGTFGLIRFRDLDPALQALPVKEALCLWGGSELLQIRLNPGYEIMVLDDGATSGARLMGGEVKWGEVWWLNINAETGDLISAHMQQQFGSGSLIQIPFDDLQYYPGRKCFILRTMPRSWAGTPPASWRAPRSSAESGRIQDFH